ncbi:flagellin [Halobacteria archaeon AArc-dxtr1]|nr:flagellin [Halobacteria archaeon AArc-dxtr1]
MSGESLSHLVLFVASIVVAGSVAGILIVEVGQVNEAIETRGSGVVEEIETDIAIISDPGQSDAIYDEESSNVTVLVQNTGSASLLSDPMQVDVVVDGTYIPNDDLEVETVYTDSDVWGPDEIVEVTAATDSLDIQHDTEVLVIVNGNEAVLDFYVSE